MGNFYMRDRIIKGVDAAKGRAYVEQLRATGACRQIVDYPPQVYGPDSISSSSDLLKSVLDINNLPTLLPPVLDPLKVVGK